MQTKIRKWGKSAVVWLPATMLKQLKLTVGAPVTLNTEDGNIIITPAHSKRYKLADLLTGVTEENKHSAIDWGKPVGNEV